MLHAQIAHQWGTQPGFAQTLRRWTWCREALPMLMQRLATTDTFAGGLPTVDLAALGRAFWPWAGTLDANEALEPIDPVDYAHHSVGMLLAEMVRQRPLRSTTSALSEEIRVLTDTALTLLAAWRQALDARPLAEDLRECPAALWSSYVENVCEDSSEAIIFLDMFTGREPVYRFQTLMAERPPFKAALERRHGPGA